MISTVNKRSKDLTCEEESESRASGLKFERTKNVKLLALRNKCKYKGRKASGKELIR